MRANRTANIGPTVSNDRSHNGMAKGFGGKSSWNGNIWGDNNLGNGFDGKKLFFARVVRKRKYGDLT